MKWGEFSLQCPAMSSLQGAATSSLLLAGEIVTRQAVGIYFEIFPVIIGRLDGTLVPSFPRPRNGQQ
jgi:hypothetical protein